MPATSRNVARGFTLVELLVAVSLTLILTTLVTQFLFPSLRYQSRGLVQSELMRQGYLAMDGLIRDLRVCPAAVLSFDPASSRLCGRVGSDWTPDGTALYSAECWVYEWEASGQRLRRTEVSIGGSALDSLPQPGRVAPPDLERALIGARWKSLCSHLARFEFSHQGVDPQAPSGRYTVRMSMQQDLQRLELRQTVMPRLSR